MSVWQILNCLNIITNATIATYSIWPDKMGTFTNFVQYFMQNFKYFWRNHSLIDTVLKKLYIFFFFILNVDTRFWQKIIKLDRTKKMLLASSCSIFISWWIKILPSLAKRLAKKLFIYFELKLTKNLLSYCIDM